MPEIKKQPIASAVPDFNADSAYAYVANQVAFGPRVPNTAAHKACGDYLASELKRFGAKVYQQGSDTDRLRRNEAGSEKHHRLV